MGFERGVARDLQREGVDNLEKWKTDWMPREQKYWNEQAPDSFADMSVPCNILESNSGLDFYCPVFIGNRFSIYNMIRCCKFSLR